MTFNKKDNYCTFSPDELFNVRFNYACYLHDRQYRNEVKVRKTRKQSDQLLKQKIYNIYSNKNKKVIGFFVSNIYYFIVRLFSKWSWINDR